MFSLRKVNETLRENVEEQRATRTGVNNVVDILQEQLDIQKSEALQRREDAIESKRSRGALIAGAGAGAASAGLFQGEGASAEEGGRGFFGNLKLGAALAAGFVTTKAAVNTARRLIGGGRGDGKAEVESRRAEAERLAKAQAAERQVRTAQAESERFARTAENLETSRRAGVVDSEAQARRTTSLINEYYRGSDSPEARQAAADQRIRIANQIATRNTLRRLQNINAAPLDVAPTNVQTDAPARTMFAEGDRVSYTRVDGTTVDATVRKTLDNGRVQLKFEGGGPIAVDAERIANSIDKSVPKLTEAVENTGPKITSAVDASTNKLSSAIDNSLNKSLRVAGAFSIEGAAEEAARFGASKTTGGVSKALGTTARVLGSLPSIAASIVVGGLFENQAGDGTLAGVIDAQALALFDTMRSGETDKKILEARDALLNRVSDSIYSPIATKQHKALAMLSDQEVLNLANMVYAKTSGQVRGAVNQLGITQGELSSARFGQGRQKFGEELNALDLLAINTADQLRADNISAMTGTGNTINYYNYMNPEGVKGENAGSVFLLPDAPVLDPMDPVSRFFSGN